MKKIRKTIILSLICSMFLGSIAYAATVYGQWIKDGNGKIKTSIPTTEDAKINEVAWTLDDGKIHRINPSAIAGTNDSIEKEYKIYYVETEDFVNSQISANEYKEKNILKGQHAENYSPPKGEKIEFYKASVAYNNHTDSHCAEIDTITSFGKKFIGKANGEYQSDGWILYCKECGKPISGYFYTGIDGIKALNGSVVQGSTYYSECSICGGLETLGEIIHSCKAKVEWNKYTIHYAKSDYEVVGGAADTIHTYNNNKQDKGGIQNPDNTLRDHPSSDANNTFSWNGREKTLVGWVTGDGNLTFSLGDAWGNDSNPNSVQQRLILNNYIPENGNKEITLYTVFEDSLSTLIIKPNGGKFNNTTEDTKFENLIYEQKIDLTNLEAPAGYLISFKDGANEAANSITTTKSFDRWEKDALLNTITSKKIFNGYLARDNSYYRVNNYLGDVDILKAIWKNNSIILPEAKKDGYSFAGWYSDAEFTDFVGKDGDEVVFNKNTTLYARFANLTLYSTKEKDYDTTSEGVTNLHWAFNNNRYNYYNLFESTDGNNWTEIGKYETKDSSNFTTGTDTYAYTGTEQIYDIAENGIYEFTAVGAQGENYNEHTGGKGGEITAKLKLYKGEKLHIFIGGQSGWSMDGYEGGTAEDFDLNNLKQSNGGGATVIILESPTPERNNKPLLIAAGGGGATAEFDGGNGNNNDNSTLLVNSAGESGISGGGGGYHGGIAGISEYLCRGTLVKKTTSSTESPLYGYPRASTAADGTVTCKCGQHDGKGCGYSGVFGTTTKYPSGNIWWEGTCPSCGHSSSGGKKAATTTAITYTCNICGTVHSSNSESAANKYCVKKINVNPVAPSYGGSNYYNEDLFTIANFKVTENEGNGSCKIFKNLFGETGDYIGVLRNTPDKENPNPVSNHEETKIGVNYEIIWDEPSDAGSPYYHKVILTNYENDEKDNEVENVIESNITSQVFTSNVYKYLFTYNTDKKYEIKKDSISKAVHYTQDELELITAKKEKTTNGITTSYTTTYYSNANELRKVILKENPIKGYLHIAVVDKAGNISTTYHAELEGKELLLEGNIITKNLTITSNSNNLYKATSDKYYVRADSQTPFNLAFDAISGYSVEEILISDMMFHLTNEPKTLLLQISGSTDIYCNDTAYHNNVVNEYIQGTSTSKHPRIEKLIGTPDIIKDGYYVEITRPNTIVDEDNNGISSASILQSFIANKEYSGRKYFLYPSAKGVITHDEEKITSSDAKDRLNGFYLILDGNAPAIDNVEEFEDGCIESDTVTLKARDEGEYESGVKSFYVVITNPKVASSDFVIPGDNQNEITIDFTDEAIQALFEDEFKIKIYAEDNVGNVYEESYNLLTFNMETKLERILAPHNPNFQSGEAGLLTIDLFGVADTVIVTMPYELLQKNESRCQNQTYNVTATQNDVYTYIDLTNGTKTDVIHKQGNQTTYQYKFWMPLYSPEGLYDTGGDYSPIIIKAYRNGKLLQTNYEGFTISGTILDEFRTSIVK